MRQAREKLIGAGLARKFEARFDKQFRTRPVKRGRLPSEELAPAPEDPLINSGRASGATSKSFAGDGRGSRQKLNRSSIRRHGRLLAPRGAGRSGSSWSGRLRFREMKRAEVAVTVIMFLIRGFIVLVEAGLN